MRCGTRGFEAAHRRLKTAPADLTTTDIELLSMFDPSLGREGIERQFKALHSADPAPVPRQAPAACLDIDTVAGAVIDVISTAITPLVARIEQLENRPAVKYFGTHKDGTAYLEGSMTTRSGGLWVATRATTATPGTDDSGWLLAVKKGQAERYE